jgi:TetR/AcrR family transcriptional regulator, mexJK operon transcriptional repressor
MPPSISERKREEIARAALMLFARDGYERTSVDAIAAEAGVSKRTVYSHYGDKESLFLAVVQDTYSLMRLRFAQIMSQLPSDVTESGDPEKSLVSLIRGAVADVSHTPERANLLRAVIAEMPRFPRLAELWQSRAIGPILTEQVSRLVAAGVLKADDPQEAADHLSALTFGQLNNRSMMGTIPLSDAEIDRIIASGVHVFLCAYAAR